MKSAVIYDESGKWNEYMTHGTIQEKKENLLLNLKN